jgi:hypothetical protein
VTGSWAGHFPLIGLGIREGWSPARLRPFTRGRIAIGTVALLSEGHALDGHPAGYHIKYCGHEAVLRVLDDFDDVVDHVVGARCGVSAHPQRKSGS